MFTKKTSVIVKPGNSNTAKNILENHFGAEVTQHQKPCTVEYRGKPYRAMAVELRVVSENAPTYWEIREKFMEKGIKPLGF